MNECYQIQQKGGDLENRMVAIDRSAAQSVMNSRRETILARFWPDELQRAAARHRLRIAENEFEFMEKALYEFRNTQLRAISEYCDDQRVKWETPRKRALAEFVMQQKIEMESQLLQLCAEYNDMITNAFKQAESLTIPQLREKAIERLYISIDNYNEMAGIFQKRFQETVTGAAQKYGSVIA